MKIQKFKDFLNEKITPLDTLFGGNTKTQSTPKKALDLSNVKEGDTVNIECFSGHGEGGPSTVDKILVKYDSDSGEKFNVIVVDGDHKFDSRTGNAMNAPTAYYISSVKK